MPKVATTIPMFFPKPRHRQGCTDRRRGDVDHIVTQEDGGEGTLGLVHPFQHLFGSGPAYVGKVEYPHPLERHESCLGAGEEG